jgi:hypothetical protein
VVAHSKTPFYEFTVFFLRLGEVIMKAVKGNLFAVEIKGKVNTTNRSRDQWAQITDARSGRILHTGQPRYIKRVAKAKYNTLLDI